MKTSASLSNFYHIMAKVVGPVEAKESASAAIFLVLSEIIDEGLQVTPELIEQKLSAYVKNFIDIAEKNKVA